MKHAPPCLAAALIAACTSFLVGPDPVQDRVAMFEHVWRDMDRHYALFVAKAVNWDSLNDAYAPQAAQAATDEDLVEVVGQMLLELRDAHVSVRLGLRLIFYRGHEARPAFFDAEVVRSRYVPDRGTAPAGQVHFGHAATDIGYLWIPSFAGAGFGTDLDAVLAQLGDMRALIVDIRDNGGGTSENSEAVAGRFADRDRIYAVVRHRDGPRHDDFTPPEQQVVSPAGARRFAGPVAVLTNRRSISGAEWFGLAMRALPTVMIVGDSTAGALAIPLARELPRGMTYTLSASLVQSPDHEHYEERGLAPDVWVRGSAEELAAGRDAVLDTALAVLGRALPSSISAQEPRKPNPGPKSSPGWRSGEVAVTLRPRP